MFLTKSRRALVLGLRNSLSKKDRYIPAIFYSGGITGSGYYPLDVACRKISCHPPAAGQLASVRGKVWASGIKSFARPRNEPTCSSSLGGKAFKKIWVTLRQFA
jgi:hypothetical protein